MSLERDIKETLGRHAGDVRPSPGAWRGIERRVRRTHRMRMVAGSVAAAAAVAALAVAVPKVLERPAPTFVAPGPEDGTAGWLRYRDEATQYRLLFPPDWNGGSMFEGSTEFRPLGLPPAAKGEDTFFVSVSRAEGSFEQAGHSVPGGGTVAEPSPVRINGRSSTRFETTGPTGIHSVQYRIDWTGLGCAPDAEDCSAPSTLSVEVFASTENLWRSNGAIGERLVATIEAVYSSGSPTEEDPVLTRRGSVADGVEYDALTSALVRFMDARLEVGLPSFWLTAEASAQYKRRAESKTGLLPAPGQVWLDYTIQERAGADANSAEFSVSVSFQPNEKDSLIGFTETIGIGPGTSVGGNELPAVVRFTRLEGIARGSRGGRPAQP